MQQLSRGELGSKRDEIVATVALHKGNFDETVSANDVVLVDFWASWCDPCRVFSPVFEAASEHHTDIVFAKVDTDAEQELAAEFGIMSIPTLMAFRDQVLLYAQAGALPASALEKLIGTIKALDMDDVRPEVGRRIDAAL